MPASPRLPGSAALALCLVLAAGTASAQKKAPPPRPAQSGDTEQPKPVDTSDAPEPAEQPEFQVPAPAPTVAEGGVATGGAEEEEAPKDLHYGVAGRMRWVSVPHWLLGLFTEHNQSLSSYHAGFELYRRKGEHDLVLGFSYQNMSPPDGNWLGKNESPEEKTDFVQFKNFGIIGLDFAFIWHKNFNDYFGIHYGAGIGVAFITGKILRTSSQGCTKDNLGDYQTCKPVVCTNALDCETQLKQTEAKGGRSVDEPKDPSRFKDENAPPVVPIVNITTGIDFHVPQAKGLEFRIEGGFYDAFFAGGAISYAF